MSPSSLRLAAGAAASCATASRAIEAGRLQNDRIPALKVLHRICLEGVKGRPATEKASSAAKAIQNGQMRGAEALKAVHPALVRSPELRIPDPGGQAAKTVLSLAETLAVAGKGRLPDHLPAAVAAARSFAKNGIPPETLPPGVMHDGQRIARRTLRAAELAVAAIALAPDRRQARRAARAMWPDAYAKSGDDTADPWSPWERLEDPQRHYEVLIKISPLIRADPCELLPMEPANRGPGASGFKGLLLPLARTLAGIEPPPDQRPAA